MISVSDSTRLLRNCCAFLRNISLRQHTASRTTATSYLRVPRGRSGERQSLHIAVSDSTRLLRNCCKFLWNISLPQHTATRTAAATYLRMPGARGGSGERQPLHRAVSCLTRLLRNCCEFLWNISLPQHTASRTTATSYLTVPGAKGRSGEKQPLHRAVTRLDC